VITEIQISLRNDPQLKAFVSITIANCFVVRGLKVMHAGVGLSVIFPCRRQPGGTHLNLAFPTTPEYRAYLEREVLQAYWREMGDDWTTGAAVPIRPGPGTLEARAARALPRAYSSTTGWPAPSLVQATRPFCTTRYVVSMFSMAASGS
jgi:stage V sporulation protein G